jgi:hypothetical protein
MRKVIEVNKTPVITPAMERAVERAFMEYEGGQVINLPQKEHLDSKWVEGISCKHNWIELDTTPNKLLPDGKPDFSSHRPWFEANFEEKEFDTGHVCTVCGATCLKDGGELWAYDATSQAFGYPVKKPQPKKKEQRRERR